MTDPYENIRRALAEFEGKNPAFHDILVARLARVCTPDTIRALLTERDALASALEAAREDVWHLEPWRDAVFDGAAVFAALNRNARPRTSPENVADVLDAVANVARSAIDQARGKENRNG